MPPYRLQFKGSVEKDLRRLDAEPLKRVLKRIERLAEDPLPRQTTKLSGGERLFRLRVGDYRIIYEVDSATRSVTIHYVRHRSVAYDRL